LNFYGNHILIDLLKFDPSVISHHSIPRPTLATLHIQLIQQLPIPTRRPIPALAITAIIIEPDFPGHESYALKSWFEQCDHLTLGIEKDALD
jgi:hypothetical protein